MTTLSAVKRFMESRHRASVSEVAIGLDTTPDVARSLLEMWRTKKKARRLVSICASCGSAASGACSCPGGADVTDVYEWVETQQGNPDAF
jgi:hypothetical protein